MRWVHLTDPLEASLNSLLAHNLGEACRSGGRPVFSEFSRGRDDSSLSIAGFPIMCGCGYRIDEVRGLFLGETFTQEQASEGH
jgi:hypothetical protein